MPPYLSVDVNSHEEQPRQTPVHVIIERSKENEPEYMGPPLHMQIPPKITQPTVQYQYQGFQSANSGVPLSHPGEAPIVVPPHAYLGAPYASYEVQYAHATNSSTHMVNSGLMYPAQMVPQVSTPQTHPQFQAPLVPVLHYQFPYVIATQYQ